MLPLPRNYKAYLGLHILGTGVYEVLILAEKNPTTDMSQGVWVMALEASSDISWEDAYNKLVRQLKEMANFSHTHKIWLGMLDPT